MAISRQIAAADIQSIGQFYKVTVLNVSLSWSGPADPLISSSGSIFGTLTQSSIAAAHKFNLDNDNVDASTSNGLSNLYAGHSVNGVNVKGHRNAGSHVIAVSGKTANVTPGWYYTASSSIAVASVNDNGTAPQPRGNLFGGNDSASLLSGATFWNSVCGREIDVEARSGTSVAYKIGLQIVQLSTDAVAGSVVDYGFAIANQSGGAQLGWDYGITLGAKNGVWAIKSTGTIIGADTTSLGGPSYAASYGVDLSNITFSGAAFVAPLITPASSSATGKVGSIVWDAGFIYICTATNTWKRAALTTF